MSAIADRLSELGFVLPPPMLAPAGVVLPFSTVLVRGNRVLVSGHGPQDPDGSIARPLGKVGAELTAEQGRHAAHLTALGILGSLERAIGDLDRITGWTRVFGMVNAAPGFEAMPSVINGFTDVIIEVFGPDIGAHARSAIGVAELPFSIPVEIECEVEIR